MKQKSNKFGKFQILALIVFSSFLAQSKVNALNIKSPINNNIDYQIKNRFNNNKILEDSPSFRPENFQLSFYSSLLLTTTGILLLIVRLCFLDSEE